MNQESSLSVSEASTVLMKQTAILAKRRQSTAPITRYQSGNLYFCDDINNHESLKTRKSKEIFDRI